MFVWGLVQLVSFFQNILRNRSCFSVPGEKYNTHSSSVSSGIRVYIPYKDIFIVQLYNLETFIILNRKIFQIINKKLFELWDVSRLMSWMANFK